MPVINGRVVTDSQSEVYEVLKRYGPVADHALVPLAQHQLQVKQSSSGIRSRRAELAVQGLVKPSGTTKTGANRTAVVWEAK